MGVNLALDIKEESIEDAMKKLGMKEGFDVGLEMSGNSSAFRNMVDVMCHGGKIALLGIQNANTLIDWDKVVLTGLPLKAYTGARCLNMV